MPSTGASGKRIYTLKDAAAVSGLCKRRVLDIVREKGLGEQEPDGKREWKLSLKELAQIDREKGSALMNLSTILAMRESGHSYSEIAAHVGVCRQTVYRWCIRHQEEVGQFEQSSRIREAIEKERQHWIKAVRKRPPKRKVKKSSSRKKR